MRPQLPALSRRFTFSSRRPVRSRIIQALLYVSLPRPRSGKIESLIRNSRCQGANEIPIKQAINPRAVSSMRISDRCPALRPPCSSISLLPVQRRAVCDVRGFVTGRGLGNAGRLSVASPDPDSSFRQSERRRCGAFRGMLRGAGDEGSVTQCRRSSR